MHVDGFNEDNEENHELDQVKVVVPDNVLRKERVGGGGLSQDVVVGSVQAVPQAVRATNTCRSRYQAIYVHVYKYIYICVCVYKST